MNKKEINDFYNSTTNQSHYTYAIDNVGLWESEKIMFEKYSNKNSKILDLGCGAGRTTINLFKIGYKDIVGLDYSEKLILCAQKYCEDNNLDITFVHGDATNLSEFSDNTYDIILFSYNGLTSIPEQKNRDKVLYEVKRLLKDNGVFIFTAHDRENPKYKSIWEEEKIKWNNGLQDKNLYEYGDRFVELEDGIAFGHYSSVNEIKEFITKNGFTLVENRLRSEICNEPEQVTCWSKEDTMFYVIKKS